MVTLAGHGARRTRSSRRPVRRADAVLLVATGEHAAALRAVLTSLPESADLTVILRTATASRADMAVGAELAELVLRRGGRLVELVGARSAVALDAARLQAMVSDVAARDLYVCGPAWFADTVVLAARGAGVPESRIHLTAGTI